MARQVRKRKRRPRRHPSSWRTVYVLAVLLLLVASAQGTAVAAEAFIRGRC